MAEPLHPVDPNAHSSPPAQPAPVDSLGFHPSAPFIRRPVATFLLSIALVLAGAAAYRQLPIASLPQVEYPTISVTASLPGADPETVASAIATPLERQFGRIAGINQMTSTSSIGTASVLLQFDLDRDVNGAARDVEAAINAARSQLPANLPGNPTYRKVNPSDPPILILALTSPSLPVAQLYDAADSIIAQRISQIPGVGDVTISGSAKPAVRVEVNPMQLSAYGLGLDAVTNMLGGVNVNRPKGFLSNDTTQWSVSDTDQLGDASTYAPLILTWRNGAPVRLRDARHRARFGRRHLHPRRLRHADRDPDDHLQEPRRQHHRHRRRHRRHPAGAESLHQPFYHHHHRHRPHRQHPRLGARGHVHTLVLSIVLVTLVVFCFLREVPSTIIPSVSGAALSARHLRRDGAAA